MRVEVALMMLAQNNIILPLADLDESAESRLRSEASFKNHYSDLFADPARGGNNFFKTDRRWTRKTWCVDGACWTEAARAARDGSMKCLWMELEVGSAGDCFICTICAAVNICSLFMITTEAIKENWKANAREFLIIDDSTCFWDFFSAKIFSFSEMLEYKLIFLFRCFSSSCRDLMSLIKLQKKWWFSFREDVYEYFNKWCNDSARNEANLLF